MKRIRQWLTVLLLLSMVLCTTIVLAKGNSYIQCDCFFGDCDCFIQLGDEGGAVNRIIRLLIRKKYLPKGTSTDCFSKDVESAVKQFQKDNLLDITGTMDDDTLTLLLWDMLPEELDITDGGTAACRTVYIPTDGGKRRHLKETCSGMKDPRKVSDRNAEELGFDRCKKCYK